MLFVSVLVLLSVIAFSQLSVFADKEKAEYISYIVRPNDSLWSIAKTYGNNDDIRKTVYEIEKINGVDSDSLKVGIRLFIPNI